MKKSKRRPAESSGESAAPAESGDGAKAASEQEVGAEGASNGEEAEEEGEVSPSAVHGSVSGLRNLSLRSAKKGGDKLELSRSGKPSRKSTRKSKGRLKRTTNLQLRAERKTCAPSSRAERRP